MGHGCLHPEPEVQRLYFGPVIRPSAERITVPWRVTGSICRTPLMKPLPLAPRKRPFPLVMMSAPSNRGPPGVVWGKKTTAGTSTDNESPPAMVHSATTVETSGFPSTLRRWVERATPVNAPNRSDCPVRVLGDATIVGSVAMTIGWCWAVQFALNGTRSLAGCWAKPGAALH